MGRTYQQLPIPDCGSRRIVEVPSSRAPRLEADLGESIFLLHYGVLFTSTVLVREIGANRARIEAATIQIVGEQEAQPCRHCRFTETPSCTASITTTRQGTVTAANVVRPTP